MKSNSNWNLKFKLKHIFHLQISFTNFNFSVIKKSFSGSTSPTTRRLEYPYSYDSASKFNGNHLLFFLFYEHFFLN